MRNGSRRTVMNENERKKWEKRSIICANRTDDTIYRCARQKIPLRKKKCRNITAMSMKERKKKRLVLVGSTKLLVHIVFFFSTTCRLIPWVYLEQCKSLTKKFIHHNTFSFSLLTILAIFLPPVAALIQVGCTLHFFLNM